MKKGLYRDYIKFKVQGLNWLRGGYSGDYIME